MICFSRQFTSTKFHKLRIVSLRLELSYSLGSSDFPAQGPVIRGLAFVTKKLTRFSCKYLPRGQPIQHTTAFERENIRKHGGLAKNSSLASK